MTVRFYGTIRINPIHLPAFEITGEWEYVPENGCYYCKGESFPEEICEVLNRGVRNGKS